ncbi:hypothetical protein MLD38_016307 [Melastoma candidum]|uniref:Uncharacterized protein n=1 Tax=Melastoma candidum TaxID=119954 RepID=A0ACB9RIQ4_9MYRT|nr:hypothetical protein MLD38_016307 [Melastoma candidum]
MAVPKSPKSTPSNPNPTCPASAAVACPSSGGTCKHSLVDLLFLLLLLLSSSFLIASVLSYLSRSLSLLFPSLLPSSSSLPLSLSLSLPLSPFFVLSFLAFFALAAASSLLLSFPRSRLRCHRPSCKALTRALEFDLQLQSEDQLRTGKGPVEAVERLPWKGGSENNPDYECLRAELRRMAPVNGRAVLLFREKCGCPVAKLVGWGPRKGPGGKKNKRALSGVSQQKGRS